MRRMLSWLAWFNFRHIAGLLMLAVACWFMAVNSGILYDGASRYALTEGAKLRYGSVAATIPWVLGLMPFLVALTWVPAAMCKMRPFTWVGRPSTWTVPIVAVWALFLAYNTFGAGGSVAFVRSDVVSSRNEQVDKTQSSKKRRDSLQAELDDLAKAKVRSPAAVEALMATERARNQWEWSENCRLPTSGAEKKFCANYNNLKGELAQAQRRDRLETQLGEVSGKAQVAGWVETADPLAHFWSGMLGVDESTVARYAPIATPIVLEVGSWVFLGFALILLGFQGHRDVISGAPVLHASSGGSRGSQPAPAVSATSSPTFQFADRWLSDTARPVQTGSLEEGQWYSLYSQQCASLNVVPIALTDFRALAEARGIKVTTIDGRAFYQRWMPARVA